MLVGITVEIARELWGACERLGLRLLALRLAIQIVRLHVSDGRHFSGQVLGGQLQRIKMTREERAALAQKAVMARRAKAAASEVRDKPRPQPQRRPPVAQTARRRSAARRED